MVDFKFIITRYDYKLSIIFLFFQNVKIHSEAVITVHPQESSKSSMYYILQVLKKELPKVMIKVRKELPNVMIKVRKELPSYDQGKKGIT